MDLNTELMRVEHCYQKEGISGIEVYLRHMKGQLHPDCTKEVKRFIRASIKQANDYKKDRKKEELQKKTEEKSRLKYAAEMQRRKEFLEKLTKENPYFINSGGNPREVDIVVKALSIEKKYGRFQGFAHEVLPAAVKWAKYVSKRDSRRVLVKDWKEEFKPFEKEFFDGSETENKFVGFQKSDATVSIEGHNTEIDKWSRLE